MASQASTLDKHVNFLTSRINSARSLLQFRNAAFFAEKLHILKKDYSTLLEWTECLYLCKDYKTAVFVLQNWPDYEYSLRCQYLAALAQFDSGKFDDANNIINESIALIEDHVCTSTNHILQNESEWKSSVYLLQGKIAETNRNTLAAIKAYKRALQLDSNCFEAFSRLTRNQIMHSNEEAEFLKSLDSDGEYCSKVSKIYFHMNHPFIVGRNDLASEIEQLFDNCYESKIKNALAAFDDRRCEDAIKICKEVRTISPYDEKCLSILIACMFEMGQSTELFSLSHELLKVDRNWAIAYFSIGSYYMTICVYEPARRFFRKAIQCDQMNGHYWIALGHAFSADAEHDQAITCYFTAQNSSEAHTIHLSEKFFTEAFYIKADDPYLIHEVGVVQYQLGKYEEALKSFETAKIMINSPSQHWESLFSNLGNVHRKLRNYSEALIFFDMSLDLKPSFPPTLIAKALVLLNLEDYSAAFDILHTATWWTKDQMISNQLLVKMIGHSIDLRKPPPATSPAEFTDNMDIFKLRPRSLFRDIEESAACGDIVNKLIDDDCEQNEQWMECDQNQNPN
ncbi:hypothetical protein GJ496_007419 [Pomphorhynchus laevis]|nr:hypothetical protein GJ496_007419 [Pomphorhynchus laevis]